jgi:hypothetical protein
MFYLNYLPQTLNVYFTYICAFSGILYTKYLESQLSTTTDLTSILYLLNQKLKNSKGNTTNISKIKRVEEEENNNNYKKLKNNKFQYTTPNVNLLSNSTLYNTQVITNNKLNSKEMNVSACCCNIKSSIVTTKQRRKLSVSSFSSILPKRRISLPIIPVKTDKVR